MPPQGSLPYFADTAARVAGSSLTGMGFTLVGQTPTRVTFQRDDTLVSFAYYTEDLPTPWVAVEVGLVAADGARRLVGLWRALPEGAPARAYTSWTFHDEPTLEVVLQRLITQVLPDEVARLLDSRGSLEALIASQDDEAETTYLEHRHSADLQRARRAHDEGRFQDAVDGFALLGTESLSAADRRRLYQARQKLAAAGEDPPERAT